MSDGEVDGRWNTPPTPPILFYLQIRWMDHCSRKKGNSFGMNHGIGDRSNEKRGNISQEASFGIELTFNANFTRQCSGAQNLFPLCHGC